VRDPLYGCPTCGAIGWTRPGERVDGAGEEGGTPLVRKAPRPGPVSGEWIGDCGHLVPKGSPLARVLDALAPHSTGWLEPNRPVEMEDWRPSAIR
jgi:hypothetical protein